jgi:RNA-binding protein YhbY
MTIKIKVKNKESETLHNIFKILSTSITVEFTDIKGNKRIFKHRDIEYWYCEELR